LVRPDGQRISGFVRRSACQSRMRQKFHTFFLEKVKFFSSHKWVLEGFLPRLSASLWPKLERAKFLHLGLFKWRQPIDSKDQ
jgi:hypothetical protein